jgi:hypothetical protein
MVREVILDGRYVLASEITPAHRYVGMWRPATDPIAEASEQNLKRAPEDRWSHFICVCGADMEYRDNGSHWRKGCFDVPQYSSMGKADAKEAK